MQQNIKVDLNKETAQQISKLKTQLHSTFNDPEIKSSKQVMLDAAFDDFDVQAGMNEVIRQVDLINVNSGLAFIDQGTEMEDFHEFCTEHATTQTKYFDMLINNIIDNQEVQVNIVPKSQLMNRV